MDYISSYYQELCLLQLKYEHLTELSRNLLKPWPVEKEQAKEDSANGTFQNEQEATISKTEPPAKELEQLDVLLSRAQKLRIGTKPEEKLSKKSIKLASSIYKASDHGNSTTRPHKEAAARQRTKDQTRTKQTGHAQSKSVTSLLGRDVERSRATRSTSLKAISDGRGRSENTREVRGKSEEPALSAERSTEPQGFSVKKDGTRLSLPSKYSRLRKLASECSEILAQEDEGSLTASRAAANHFTKRLLAKSSVDRIRLQLSAETLQHLREKLASITPQEWTVSERSHWEDVLLLRTKLETLTHCYQAASSLLSSRTHGHSSKPTPDITTRTEHDEMAVRSKDGQLPEELGYTSLSDWNRLTAARLRERHLQCEVKYLARLEEIVRPLASSRRTLLNSAAGGGDSRVGGDGYRVNTGGSGVANGSQFVLVGGSKLAGNSARVADGSGLGFAGSSKLRNGSRPMDRHAGSGSRLAEGGWRQEEEKEGEGEEGCAGAVAVLRGIHVASNLQGNPVYLNTDYLTQQPL